MSKYLYKTGAACARSEKRSNSFDRALLSAGVGNYNLLRVTSILPAYAERTDQIIYEEGELLPTAYAKFIVGPISENESQSIAAAVAIGIPVNRNEVGVIMEWAGYGDKSEAEQNVANMIKTAMKDRGVCDYDIVMESVDGMCAKNNYTCVFACVALMRYL